MSFQTPTGKGTVSMAATLHMAAIVAQGLTVLLPAIWVSRLVANLIIQRQPWYKAVFNGAQVALAVAAASLTYMYLGGVRPVVLGTGIPTGVIAAWAAAAGAYYVINTGLVSGVIALAANTSFWHAWRENYGYRVEIVSTLALFLLAPVAAVSHQALGLWGLIAFLIPMLFIRDACDRYIILERTQRALIGSERLAAKGEMAASVGHELNNYLAVLTGNLQLMQMIGGDHHEKDKERLKNVVEQVKRMSTLSKGLMDFSHLDSKPVPTDLRRLLQDTLDFLGPQNRFDGVDVSLETDPRIGVVSLDPAQIQQVLMNLAMNAADAMGEADTLRSQLRIWARWDAGRTLIELGVEDSGPATPPELRRRLFDPGFTTREAGHGFGLSTVYRIVSNHGGKIAVEDGRNGGTIFRIQLPVVTSNSRALSAA